MSFLSSIDKLNVKINDLEERIEKISSKEKMTNESGVNIYTKSLLNLHILSQKTIDIETLDNSEKNHLFFQLKIKFLNYSEQIVQFKLFADKVLVNQDNTHFDNGMHEAIISGIYQNQISDFVKIQLQAIAKSKKQITLIETTLTVWGSNKKHCEEYEAIECDSKIFLSYINNKQLFYKYFNKDTNCENIDFTFLDNSISHSICNFSNSLYLFRVDTDGNLFYSNFLNETEKFISDNVSKVTCCGTDSGIVFCYISLGKVYYGEIYNNVVISNNQINFLLGELVNCHLHFNKYNNKCYLLLTKKDMSNYLLESIPNSFCSSENICAEISLNISIT